MKGRVFVAILGALVAVGVFAGAAQAIPTPTQTRVVLVGTNPPTTNANGNPEWCEAIRIGSETLANLGAGFNTPVAGGTTVTYTVRHEPSGTVAFTGTGTTSTSPVNGRATVTIPACTLDVGNYEVTASYPAATGNAASTGTLDFRVTRARTRLNASSSFTRDGKAAFVRFRARLTRADNGAPISGQRIVFRDADGNRICADTTDSNGVAACTRYEIASSSAVGQFTAQFRQTPHYRGSSDVASASAAFNGTFYRPIQPA